MDRYAVERHANPRRENGQVWLMPHDPAYQPIPGDDAVVLGNVVAVLRAP